MKVWGLGGNYCSALKVIHIANSLVFSMKEADLEIKIKQCGEVLQNCAECLF